MSTAIVVAVVLVLMLLGIGMVANQLLRLRRYLNSTPPDQPPAADPPAPPAR
ncbi:hypothetical protein [Mycobacterium sp. 050134]|uniref:hypothetical protein n=1 Tax=Mycobacterium sp. 050134 TaxID=3096111 RepID=UPI002ED8A0EE